MIPLSVMRRYGVAHQIFTDIELTSVIGPNTGTRRESAEESGVFVTVIENMIDLSSLCAATIACESLRLCYVAVRLTDDMYEDTSSGWGVDGLGHVEYGRIH